MAAALTAITRLPYDAQHLPFTTVRFVKKDTAFQFDVQVPRRVADCEARTEAGATCGRHRQEGAAGESGRDEEGPGGRGRALAVRRRGPVADPGFDTISPDQQQQTTQQGQQQGQRGAAQGPRLRRPPRNRTLHFEYDLATGHARPARRRLPAPRQPRWASLSPDEKTIVFARNHNLYMMDAGQLRAGAEEGRRPDHRRGPADEGRRGALQLRAHDPARHPDRAAAGGAGRGRAGQRRDKNARVPAVTVIWSRDSSKFAVVRRDVRKVADLWVIDALANPRPKLETYRYAMPGEANTPQSEIHVFDIAHEGAVKVKVDRFRIRPSRSPRRRCPPRRRRRRERAAPRPTPPAAVAERHARQALLHAHEPRSCTGRRVRRQPGDGRGQGARSRSG